MTRTKTGNAPGGTAPATAGLRIRRAAPQDVPELEDLVERAVLGLQARDYHGRVLGSALRSGLLAPDPRLISDRTYYVAESEGRIVGAGGWSRRRNIVNGPPGVGGLLDPATEAARIRAFYTLPERARQGIGSRLLRTCEAAARRAGFRRLELISTLTGTSLYAARGWRTRQPVEIPLPDGHTYPAIRMTKELWASPVRNLAA